jgi:hypothetical protein
VTVLLGAIACGIGLSVLKGDGEGVRSAVGNLSVPWLLIPFVAAPQPRPVPPPACVA